MKPKRQNILYLGNILSSSGRAPSTLEVLSNKLSGRYPVIVASKFSNQLLRFVDLLLNIFRYRKVTRLVLIDTFSTAAFYYALACGYFSRLFNIPYITILHGGRLPERLIRSPHMCNILFKHAYRLIAPSAFMQVKFKEAGYHNVEVIPNFIELNNYPCKLRKNAEPKLLWVRSFDDIYNPAMAVYVLAHLKSSGIVAKLCMVGPDKDGSMEKCKTLAAELGVLDQMKFTGLLSKTQWIELSADYDIFLNTTHVDNTPVSIIEALAMGMCVVSTNVGGIPYILQHGINAELVNDNDVEGMSTAILRIIRQNGYAETLSNQAMNSAMKWSWENVSEKWYELLDSIDENRQ